MDDKTLYDIVNLTEDNFPGKGTKEATKFLFYIKRMAEIYYGNYLKETVEPKLETETVPKLKEDWEKILSDYSKQIPVLKKQADKYEIKSS